MRSIGVALRDRLLAFSWILSSAAAALPEMVRAQHDVPSMLEQQTRSFLEERPINDAAITAAQPPLTPTVPFELGGGAPIPLATVMESVREHHPLIDAARASVRGAEGAHLSAEGGFDPMLEGYGFVAPLGYYRYARGDIELSQATPLWGTRVYAGYRAGRGMDNAYIPDYYGEYETLEGGEVRVGGSVPVWRDGPIDARRAAIARTELGVDAANSDLNARALELQLRGANAYFGWASAALEAKIALELLWLAEERDSQIASRVAAGAIAAIEHLENRRAVFARRRDVVLARRKLEQSAIALSYYLREESGQPRVTSHRVTPTSIEFVSLPPALDEDSLVELAWTQRPELVRYEAVLRSARVRVELAENQLAPRIDLGVQGEWDLGYGNTDESERLRPPVFEAWVHFSVPLGFRESRGELESARAALNELEAQRSAMADRVRIEVQDALSALRAAREGLELSTQAADAAEAVAIGERARFEQGAVSLLIVNLREAAAASARISVVQAQAQLATAHVALRIAVGDSL